MNWKPIASAPKGEPIIVMWEGHPFRGVAKWSDQWKQFSILYVDNSTMYGKQTQPTHWQLFPRRWE